MPWLEVASDKPRKPHNRSLKEGKDSTSITDISITLTVCLCQSKSGFSIPPPSPPPTNKHTHARICMYLHTQHINENYLQPHHFVWHINQVSACVFVRTLGFLRLSSTFPMETSTVAHKALCMYAETVLLPVWQTQLWKVCSLGKWALAQPELVFWNLGCSELQEIQKQAFLTLIYCLNNSLAFIKEGACQG